MSIIIKSALWSDTNARIVGYIKSHFWPVFLKSC